MFLLITGASGVGKTTARRAIEEDVAPDVECVEFADVVPIPDHMTIAWRQQSVEAVVQRAVARQAEDRNLLLCGDPVAVGELLATPSAIELEAIAVCLLDVSPTQHRQRLAQRGVPEKDVYDHLAFAEWMRGHLLDPQYRPDVIMTNAWKPMRWDRWASWHAGDARWRFSLIDTSALAPSDAADHAHQWCRNALDWQDVPVLSGQWWC